MDFITGLYLFFIFVSFYVSFLFLLLYFKNKDDIYKYELGKEIPSLSVLIPAYNEEDSIRQTIESVKRTNYPKDLIEILVINDGSKDRTLEIIKKIGGIRVLNKENSGKADSLNSALKMAKGEIIAVNDADSFPEKDAFIKMVNCFKDKEVGAVTGSVFVKNRNNLLEKLQGIEYVIIAFGRKLLEYIDSVFVTPGALSMYRKSALQKVGGFDAKNLTEDIEIAWNLLSSLYRIKMCFAAKTYTIVPSKFKKWWTQRLRWDIGGFQTLYKYRHTLFKKKYSSLGVFVVPFFGSYIALSFAGFFVFLFVFFRRTVTEIFSWYNSFLHNSDIFRVENLYLVPNVFTFFGILLFFVFLAYIIIALRAAGREKIYVGSKVNILIFLLFYVILMPLLLMQSVYRMIIGKIQW